MRSKLAEREQAIILRKRGVSLGEISRQLNVAKSSVSVWCRSVTLTPIQIRSLKIRGASSQRARDAYRLKRSLEISAIQLRAYSEMDRLDQSDLSRLRDIGTALYWAEGAKKKMVDITNSDPHIIRIAMLWLRKLCRVPEKKFRVSVFYHRQQDEQSIKEYWSKITGVPLQQFHKSIFKREGSGHRKNILRYGTCKIRVCDVNLLHRILAWRDQLHLA